MSVGAARARACAVATGTSAGGGAGATGSGAWAQARRRSVMADAYHLLGTALAAGVHTGIPVRGIEGLDEPDFQSSSSG